MLLGDIRLTADDHVQLYDVDGSLQCSLTVNDALGLYDWLNKRRLLLLDRYHQQQMKDKAKEKEQ